MPSSTSSSILIPIDHYSGRDALRLICQEVCTMAQEGWIFDTIELPNKGSADVVFVINFISDEAMDDAFTQLEDGTFGDLPDPMWEEDTA